MNLCKLDLDGFIPIDRREYVLGDGLYDNTIDSLLPQETFKLY